MSSTDTPGTQARCALRCFSQILEFLFVLVLFAAATELAHAARASKPLMEGVAGGTAYINNKRLPFPGSHEVLAQIQGQVPEAFQVALFGYSDVGDVVVIVHRTAKKKRLTPAQLKDLLTAVGPIAAQRGVKWVSLQGGNGTPIRKPQPTSGSLFVRSPDDTWLPVEGQVKKFLKRKAEQVADQPESKNRCYWTWMQANRQRSARKIKQALTGLDATLSCLEALPEPWPELKMQSLTAAIYAASNTSDMPRVDQYLNALIAFYSSYNVTQPVQQLVVKLPTERNDNPLTHRSGTLVMRFTVNEQGRVENAEPMVTSHGGNRAVKDTRRAMQEWRYLPAFRNGQPIQTSGVTMGIQFE